MNETNDRNETVRAATGEGQSAGPVAASGDLPRAPVGGPPVMAQVREGMAVVDAAGERVGTVEYVQMGEPEAATPQGNVARSGSLLQGAGIVGLSNEAAPDVPAPIRAQLLREGFLKVNAPWLAADRHVPPHAVTRSAIATISFVMPDLRNRSSRGLLAHKGRMPPSGNAP